MDISEKMLVMTRLLRVETNNKPHRMAGGARGIVQHGFAQLPCLFLRQ
jgi:hypothetical protein